MDTENDGALMEARARAAEWFALNRDPRRPVTDRERFWAWLKASPLNVREYLAVAGVAQQIASLGPARGESIDELVAAARAEDEERVVALHPAAAARSAIERDDGGEAPPRRWRVAALAASVLLAGVAAGFGHFLMNSDTAVRYATGAGEQRVLRLDDGSVVHLNADSVAQVRYSDAERRVELDRGQALFSVAKNPGRPFVVAAGGTEVVAIGTEFEVYRRGNDTLVTVVEGKVAVVADAGANVKAGARASAAVPTGSADPLEALEPTPGRVALTAGQRVRVAAARIASEPEPVDPRAAVAWAQRQIVFEARELADVVAEFNRYGGISIAIDDPRLAQLRISGVFDAYDAQSFVAFLERLDGVVVERGDRGVSVSLRERSGTAEPEGALSAQ